VKKLPKSRMDYDIAPLPSPDGMTVMPVAVYTAAMSVNSKAKNLRKALRRSLPMTQCSEWVRLSVAQHRPLLGPKCSGWFRPIDASIV